MHTQHTRGARGRTPAVFYHVKSYGLGRRFQRDSRAYTEITMDWCLEFEERIFFLLH